MHDCLENISSNSLEKYFQAKTELDADTQTASLIVQDVPNPPNLQWVEVNTDENILINKYFGKYFSATARTPAWCGFPGGITGSPS